MSYYSVLWITGTRSEISTSPPNPCPYYSSFRVHASCLHRLRPGGCVISKSTPSRFDSFLFFHCIAILCCFLSDKIINNKLNSAECQDENCKSCFTKAYCTSCRERFFLHADRCTSSCPDGLSANLDSGKCEKIGSFLSLMTPRRFYTNKQFRSWLRGWKMVFVEQMCQQRRVAAMHAWSEKTNSTNLTKTDGERKAMSEIAREEKMQNAQKWMFRWVAIIIENLTFARYPNALTSRMFSNLLRYLFANCSLRQRLFLPFKPSVVAAHGRRVLYP